MVEIIGDRLLSSCSIRVIGHERPSHETPVSLCMEAWLCSPTSQNCRSVVDVTGQVTGPWEQYQLCVWISPDCLCIPPLANFLLPFLSNEL